MNLNEIPCPLLKRPINSQLCLEITYAAEGRHSPDEVSEVADWETAKEICADCVHAYWNKNNLAPPFPIESDRMI